MIVNGTSPLLEVKGLKTHFFTDYGIVKAVDGVDIEVFPGEILGLVGESGCGKSVTSLSILRLINKPGKIIEGNIIFKGKDLLTLSESEMNKIRGNDIAMIFQQPQYSLNPILKVGKQIVEVFRIHRKISHKKAWNENIALLKTVGISDPESKALSYPHELSGGQAQRVMIAIGVAMQPALLIADEPTTALDVTIQAQILDLMKDLQSKMSTSTILITHDLGVIAEMANRVAVMYAGVIVEQAAVNDLFKNPLHPYTQGLIKSIPLLGDKVDRLEVIQGNVPNLINLPSGCRFASRCNYCMDICKEKEPALIEHSPAHTTRCWLYNHKEK